MLPVDVVAKLDEEDRLVYKRLLIADEAEALHRFHVYVAAHQKRDHRPNADRKSIDARVGASPSQTATPKVASSTTRPKRLAGCPSWQR